MARRAGSFGIVLLIVVVAVVLCLAARAWRGLAGRASLPPAPVAAPHPGPSSARPNLSDTRRATDAHAAAVGEALEATGR